MSDNIPYDFHAIKNLVSVKNYLFVGEEEAAEVASRFQKGSDFQTLNVILFPYMDESAAGGSNPNQGLNPKRATFTGTLKSMTINERGTKGEFHFSDGTVVHLDTQLLV